MTSGGEIKSLLFSLTFLSLCCPSSEKSCVLPQPWQWQAIFTKTKKNKKTPSGRMTQSRYWASHVCVWTHQITEPLFYSSLCSKCLEGECDLMRELEINYRGRVPDGFPTKCRLTVFIKVKCWTSKFVFVWFSHQQTALWTLGSQPHMVSPGVQMSRYSNRSRIWLLCVCNTL